MADSRAHALKQLKLKTVIKVNTQASSLSCASLHLILWLTFSAPFSVQESHCSAVQHMDMNLCDADCRNLFATVAKDHVRVKDKKLTTLLASLQLRLTERPNISR